jgi:hypothetical protein
MEIIQSIMQPLFLIGCLGFIWIICGGSWEGVKYVLTGAFWFALIFAPVIPLAYVSGWLSAVWAIGAMIYIARGGGGGGGGGDGGRDGSNY